jgi:heptosyltransferase-1
LREPLARWLYSETIRPGGTHVVEKNLSMVAALADVQAQGEPEFPLPEGETAASLPEGGFVLATPVAGWGSKQWPAERYTELAGMVKERLSIPLVLDGAPGDREYVERIAAAAPDGSATVHISTIPQLIGATRRATAVVGVDSGPLHLAAALGRPGVAVFGPTDPARNGPYGGTLTVLRSEAAATSYQRGGEPADEMREISATQVVAELAQSMGREGIG